MEPEILFTELAGRHGHMGEIILNRPKMLNALTESMCIAMHAKLHEWEQASHIKAIVIRGAGERAFCAGGDIRAVYALREQPELAQQFFWHEYRLNHCIYHLQKPYIALLDGLTMGGGAGLSINGRFRIATEKLTFAMPETGIGFFPDVGGSYFLPRCRDYIGWYLALTGTVITAVDALFAGIVDIRIESKHLSELLQELLAVPWDDADLNATVQQVIKLFALPFSPSELSEYAPIIKQCFSQSSIEAILVALKQYHEPWAHETMQILATRSPLSLKVVMEQLRRGAQLDFDECMRMEYRITQHFLQTADFFEGVRAAVIDKDRKPHWQPGDLAAVTAEQVAGFFTTLKKELNFK
ncbi:MAG TPA: enoyl-CoA hydratase/isomerase family protein [Patescibacteria group bacterium]|nr:enoyl-CoA hydratase/isomerase family protein [Gammaproteobacteria bacterium]HWA51466.1 enoyl-CoA hydratase/isomerase family protein [Patescibacteria group bacterium]